MKKWQYFLKKEWIAISLKKRISFDDLVRENRRQILEDRELMDRIEHNLETKRNRYVERMEKNS